MPVGLYFDHNVHRAIAQGLRLRGVDVLTAFEDGAHARSDSEILARATELSRVLFSCDVDLVFEARRRQQAGTSFSGVIYASQALQVSRCLADLELLAKAGEHSDFFSSLLFLPLRA